MDISTGNWFEYLREEVLTEGIRDIGLPEFVIDRIEEAMPNASEKAKMYIGNNWKKSTGSMRGAFTQNNLKYVLVTNTLRSTKKIPTISWINFARSPWLNGI